MIRGYAAVIVIGLSFGCIAPIEERVLPTTIVSWEVVGELNGQPFEASGQVACIPVARSQSLGPYLTREPFPQWATVDLRNGSMLVISNTSCIWETATEQSSSVRAYIFENSASPRRVKGVNRNEFRVRIRRIEGEHPGVSRAQVRQQADRLLRYEQLFCLACESEQHNLPYVRVVRRDIRPNAATAEFLAAFADEPAGSCSRSGVIPLPGVIEREGYEELQLAECTRLRQDDPFEPNGNGMPPEGACQSYAPQFTVVTPDPAYANDPGLLWRSDLFSDPVIVDDCRVAVRDAIARGNIRLFRSRRSTFTLYRSVDSTLFPLSLYAGRLEELERSELATAER